jgi:putative peptide maturation dehydrogenase
MKFPEAVLSMRVRRCALLMFEPRQRVEFDLSLLASGHSGLREVVELFAITPHLPDAVALSATELAALALMSASTWSDRADFEALHSREIVDQLVRIGLVVAEGSDHAARDQQVRDSHWRNGSAAMHYASRWSGVDTEISEQQFVDINAGSLLDRLGPAPSPVRERLSPDERQPLPSPPPTALDSLLDARVTCRNFDHSRSLTLDQFSAVLYRTFGARNVHDYAPGVQLLKKGVPSAGGLHPTEAYLLVQRVDGVVPGLYHYHPIDHALEPIRTMSVEETNALARTFVASQAWFVDAHVMVMPTSRFIRNFWKYRNHAKAYRALILDVGHLSQTLYLSATELGLAAFITAAVNEIDIENAFGLDPLEEGPLAVCGFGLRGPERNEVEFDPLNAVWPE